MVYLYQTDQLKSQVTFALIHRVTRTPPSVVPTSIVGASGMDNQGKIVPAVGDVSVPRFGTIGA